MPDQVAPNNKAVVFRGRAERERARLPRALRGNGLVSSKALRRFQKRAGHNPPKPAAAESAVMSPQTEYDDSSRWGAKPSVRELSLEQMRKAMEGMGKIPDSDMRRPRRTQEDI